MLASTKAEMRDYFKLDLEFVTWIISADVIPEGPMPA
jgi:hypothetical protein